MKLILTTSVAFMSCLSVAQQAPVTRSEFAAFFLPVAASLDVSEAQRKSLISFPLDEKAIDKSEVALVLIATAKCLGKEVGKNSTPIERLKSTKILPETAAIFSDPGRQFRPSDLVKAFIAFVDGISGTPEFKSADEAKLTRPRSGHGGK